MERASLSSQQLSALRIRIAAARNARRGRLGLGYSSQAELRRELGQLPPGATISQRSWPDLIGPWMMRTLLGGMETILN